MYHDDCVVVVASVTLIVLLTDRFEIFLLLCIRNRRESLPVFLSFDALYTFVALRICHLLSIEDDYVVPTPPSRQPSRLFQGLSMLET